MHSTHNVLPFAVQVQLNKLLRYADDALLMIREDAKPEEKLLWMSRAREYQIQAELLLHHV